MHKKTVQPTFVCKISKTSVWVLIISACILHPDDAIVSFRLFKLFLHNCSLFLGCFGCWQTWPYQKFNRFQNYFGREIVEMGGGGQNEGQRPKPDQNIHQI